MYFSFFSLSLNAVLLVMLFETQGSASEGLALLRMKEQRVVNLPFQALNTKGFDGISFCRNIL